MALQSKQVQPWIRILLLAGVITFFVWLIGQVREGFQVPDCAKLDNCKDCADMAGCVWCPNLQKCSAQNRSGFPKDSACDKSLFVTFSDKCATQGGPPPAAVESKDFTSNPMPQPQPEQRCPSTTKAVEDVMKVPPQSNTVFGLHIPWSRYPKDIFSNNS